MFPNELDFQVRQEQYKDLLREAEQERLIKTARLHNNFGSRKLNLSITNWLGTKLVDWGMNLQQSNPAVTPAYCDPCCG